VPLLTNKLHSVGSVAQVAADGHVAAAVHVHVGTPISGRDAIDHHAAAAGKRVDVELQIRRVRRGGRQGDGIQDSV